MIRIRPARKDDQTAIVTFTQATFPWGDYVAEQFPEWLDDPSGVVLVATDSDDLPIGMVRVVMPSHREAWLHAARVHPDHRRRGIGTALNREACRWAQQQGALVARLLVEAWNEPANRQVTKLGYRAVADWVWATRSMPDRPLDPSTNGGKRVPVEERLVRANRSESQPAWMAWSTSRLAVTGRMLVPLGWHFRRMNITDVEEAARRGALWHCPSGWVIADTHGAELVVSWVVTSDLDVDRLVKAVIDRAQAGSVSSLIIWLPAVDWGVSALHKAGFAVYPATVYARPL